MIAQTGEGVQQDHRPHTCRPDSQTMLAMSAHMLPGFGKHYDLNSIIRHALASAHISRDHPKKKSVTSAELGEPLRIPGPTDLICPRWQRELFKTILDEQNLRFDREGRPRTAYSLRHTYICLRLMEGAHIYQIAITAALAWR